MHNAAAQTSQTARHVRHTGKSGPDRAWFNMLPGETVADTLRRVRDGGWQGPIGLSLAKVA
jgi:hypothetical protein